MGVLNDHGKRSPQVILSDMPDINSVIGNCTALNFVKPVNQIDDRRLSRPGGPYKSNLLSRLCIERNPV